MRPIWVVEGYLYYLRLGWKQRVRRCWLARLQRTNAGANHGVNPPWCLFRRHVNVIHIVEVVAFLWLRHHVSSIMLAMSLLLAASSFISISLLRCCESPFLVLGAVLLNATNLLSGFSPLLLRTTTCYEPLR